MPDIAGVAVAVQVRGPLVLGRVGVAGAHVAGLQLLELLLRAQFVGLCFCGERIRDDVWMRVEKKEED